VGQINGAITQISGAVQQNAAAAEELASTAEEVNGQAAELQMMMGFFTLSHDRAAAGRHDAKAPSKGAVRTQPKPVSTVRTGKDLSETSFTRF
jgi:methyl-accepting chemotaxis protein